MKIFEELTELADPKRAKILARFFKTAKGQYGEGDVFLGITVPTVRRIAFRNFDVSLKEIRKLLESKVHEHRLCGLIILVKKYQQTNVENKWKIVDFYISNTDRINNWDLVDLSSYKILGDYLFKKDKRILYKLAKSKNLWERRIAIIATFHFIKNNEFEDTFKIAKVLLGDKHDLIQKAVGWMLREVGKRDKNAEERFLKIYFKDMSRVTLRYAIERFETVEKEIYMKG